MDMCAGTHTHTLSLTHTPQSHTFLRLPSSHHNATHEAPGDGVPPGRVAFAIHTACLHFPAPRRPVGRANRLVKEVSDHRGLRAFSGCFSLNCTPCRILQCARQTQSLLSAHAVRQLFQATIVHPCGAETCRRFDSDTRFDRPWRWQVSVRADRGLILPTHFELCSPLLWRLP